MPIVLEHRARACGLGAHGEPAREHGRAAAVVGCAVEFLPCRDHGPVCQHRDRRSDPAARKKRVQALLAAGGNAVFGKGPRGDRGVGLAVRLAEVGPDRDEPAAGPREQLGAVVRGPGGDVDHERGPRRRARRVERAHPAVVGTGVRIVPPADREPAALECGDRRVALSPAAVGGFERLALRGAVGGEDPRLDAAVERAAGLRLEQVVGPADHEPAVGENPRRRAGIASRWCSRRSRRHRCWPCRRR